MMENNLSIAAHSPLLREGCSDREYGSSENSGDDISEFSSTPDTSVESTPEISPKKRSQLSTSTGNGPISSRGKDLSLLMKPGQLYIRFHLSHYILEKWLDPNQRQR